MTRAQGGAGRTGMAGLGMRRRTGLAAGLVATLVLAAGCGSDRSAEGAGTLGIARQALGQVLAGRGGARAAAPADPAAMAAEALSVNPGPLVMAGLESSGTVQVLAMTGDNRGRRTYMTEGKQALLLERGLLIGTRGLGHDLNAARIGTEGLIRARATGQGQRVMYLLQGDGREYALPLECSVTPAGGRGFDLGGRAIAATNVTETCRLDRLEVTNNYLVTAGGEIPVSRQWVSPQLGYVTLQTLRP